MMLLQKHMSANLHPIFTYIDEINKISILLGNLFQERKNLLRIQCGKFFADSFFHAIGKLESTPRFNRSIFFCLW